MKIATTYLNPRYSGIVNALQTIMGEVTLWQSEAVPVFDFFHHVKPDILLVDEDTIDNYFLDAISDLTDTKILLFGNSVPSGIEPDVVCTEPKIPQLMKKHLELDYNVVYIHDYVDIMNFIGGKKDDRISCDVGTMFPKEIFSIELFELLLHISSLSNLKIVGDNNLSVPYFIGNMSHNRKLDFMKSCSIFLDVDGSMILETAANNVFTFSTIPNSLFPSVDIENFEEQYNTFINDEDKRKEISNKARVEVLSFGTNFHRFIDIISASSIENKDEYINKAKERIEEVLP